METKTLVAEARSDNGKGAARRLRALGKIPAVAYGNGQTARSLSVAPGALMEVLESEFGKNSLIELDVGGGTKLSALVTEYQYHPVTRSLLHADFRLIPLDQPVDVEVPLELVGKAAGIVLGGTLRQVYRSLPVRCLPNDIPVKLVLDVTALEKDQHLSVKDLPLPARVTVRLPESRTVASVVTEKKRDLEEAKETPAAGAAPAGDAAKAAPAAAAGKAPAQKGGKSDSK